MWRLHLRKFSSILAQSIAILLCALVVQTLVAALGFSDAFWPATPPGHQGIREGYFLFIAMLFLILMGTSRILESVAPSINGTLLVAGLFSSIPWLDSRTRYVIAYGHKTLRDVYQPVALTALAIIALFSIAIVIGRTLRSRFHERPKAEST